jgi:hypothetical protein
MNKFSLLIRYGVVIVIAIAAISLQPVVGKSVPDSVAYEVRGGCVGATVDTCTGEACGNTSYVKPLSKGSEQPCGSTIECGGTVECADRASGTESCGGSP